MIERSETHRVTAWLRWLAWSFVPVAGFYLVMIAVDRRQLLGESVWTKPLKFAVSIALLGASTAWLTARLRPARAVTRAGIAVVLTMLGEQALITVQAARGVRSHFNDTTPFDRAVFGVMGVLVMVAWVSLLFLALAGTRRPPADAATRAVVVNGSWLVLLGSSMGFALVAANAHSVGGADGGPGLPLVGWNTQFGDLRPAHFVGLHGLQALIVLAALAGRFGWSARQTTTLVHTATAAIGTTSVGLLVQGLARRPVSSASTALVLATAALAAGGVVAWRRAPFAPFAPNITALEALYLTASAVGLVGTWWFNLHSMNVKGGYLAGWFANAAASSAAVDLIVVSVAACAFMLVEGRRLSLRRPWLYVVLTFVIALAAMFPLFLFARERRLRRSADRSATALAVGELVDASR